MTSVWFARRLLPGQAWKKLLQSEDHASVRVIVHGPPGPVVLRTEALNRDNASVSLVCDLSVILFEGDNEIDLKMKIQEKPEVRAGNTKAIDLYKLRVLVCTVQHQLLAECESNDFFLYNSVHSLPENVREKRFEVQQRRGVKKVIRKGKTHTPLLAANGLLQLAEGASSMTVGPLAPLPFRAPSENPSRTDGFEVKWSNRYVSQCDAEGSESWALLGSETLHFHFPPHIKGLRRPVEMAVHFNGAVARVDHSFQSIKFGPNVFTKGCSAFFVEATLLDGARYVSEPLTVTTFSKVPFERGLMRSVYVFEMKRV